MKIFHLKSMIEHQKCIPTYLQTLSFDGVKLENSKCLIDYNIQEKSTLHLIIETQESTDVDINVKLPNDHIKRTAYVSQQATIGEVRKRDDEDLYYGSVLLKKDRTVQDYVLLSVCTLYAVPSGKIPLLIRYSKDNWSKVVAIQSSDTVANVRTEYVYTPNGQLFFGNRLLKGGTVGECGITAASELLVVDHGEIPVFIRTRFTEEFIAVKLSDTVSNLLRTMYRYIPQENQRLVLNQQVVDVSKTLRDYHVSSGTTFYLAITPDELDVHITLPSEQILTLICSLEETIEDIKLRIEQKEGLPVEHQILPFDNDKMTVREANVRPGMHLLLRFGKIYLIGE